MARKYSRKEGSNPPGNQPLDLKSLKEKALKFFEDYEPWYDCPVEKQDKDGNVTTRMERIANPPPSKPILAKYLGIARSTIYSDNGDKLMDSIKRIFDETYSEVLKVNGLMGMYPAAAFIFTAKNMLGWKDKSEVTGKDGAPIFPDLNKLVKEIYGSSN